MKMLKNCFEYYFSSQSKETLIDAINTQNGLQLEVKQDLIASIMLNQPDQLMEKVNNLPEHHKTDLMASIIQAREVCINEPQIQPEHHKTDLMASIIQAREVCINEPQIQPQKPKTISKSQYKRSKRNNRRCKH